MIYTEPQWNKLFLQMTAIDTAEAIPAGQPHCHEYRAWGDSLHELIEYAQTHTPGIVLAEEPKIMEYLIWDGVPAPNKHAVYKWTYKPTLRKNENLETNHIR